MGTTRTSQSFEQRQNCFWQEYKLWATLLASLMLNDLAIYAARWTKHKSEGSIIGMMLLNSRIAVSSLQLKTVVTLSVAFIYCQRNLTCSKNQVEVFSGCPPGGSISFLPSCWSLGNSLQGWHIITRISWKATAMPKKASLVPFPELSELQQHLYPYILQVLHPWKQ